MSDGRPSVARVRRILLYLVGLVTLCSCLDDGVRNYDELPGRRSWAAMATDYGNGSVLLFGGLRGCCSLRDTWEWNGRDWLPQETPDALLAGESVTLSFDGEGMLLFGGYDRREGTTYADTWRRQGGRWTQLEVAGPPGRWDHRTAWDPDRKRVVLFGGYEDGPFGDTWEWDGEAWEERSATGTGPRARLKHAMAWDAARRQILVFGGSGCGRLCGDTWAWDGVTWTELAPENSPSARTEAVMAYDPVRERIVLFGGNELDEMILGDTWEWDGTNWTRMSPEASPLAREQHTMAWDPQRETVVLFGGSIGTAPNGTPANDTWEWDGTNWSRIEFSLERGADSYPPQG